LYNIREATGGEIYRIYGMQPNGFTSCMEGASANKLAIYIKNPSVISLLYVEMNQEIRARALCWTDVQGAKIIDRVYGAEEFRTMFRDYAREIGAFKKHYDGAGESAFIAPDGTQVYRSFDIAIVGAFDTYPYIDTFCYYDEKNNILTNEYRKTTLLKLQDTSGGYEDLDGVECMNREERFDEGDTRWSDYHDMHLYYEDAIYINGDYYYEEDGCTEEAIQTGRRRWVLLEECEECEVFNADDYNGLTEQDEISTFTAYKLPNGDIIPQDEATIVNVFVIDGVIMGEVD
jgi:hypothetical protein